MSEKYGLDCKFDIEKHKQTFINYLEVIMFPDGHIEYAVPSHQDKLIEICCKQLKVSRETLYAMCPEECYFDVIPWLCSICGCIAVWNTFIMKSDKDLTEEQEQMLLTLAENGLYKERDYYE